MQLTLHKGKLKFVNIKFYSFAKVHEKPDWLLEMACCVLIDVLLIFNFMSMFCCSISQLWIEA